MRHNSANGKIFPKVLVNQAYDKSRRTITSEEKYVFSAKS
jgi:hypothetical protein